MPLSNSFLRRSLFTAALGATALTGAVSAAPKPDATKMKTKIAPAARWWPQSTQNALAQAGANRDQLVQALVKCPVPQREGLRFLLENMPVSDLQSLSSSFLLDHLQLAYEGMAKAPWKNKISRQLFLNDVLPYSSLTETRDNSNEYMRDKARPLVVDCKTPSEAAMRLNEKLFPLVDVRYSTERKRPDQSPLESIAINKASCSGLSILLVDACRAVGVPARVVGTPLWANGRGNHTWVEIWDGGWHFLGAAEPDSQGLNHGWFVADAARAREDVPQNAIYASSFKKTGLSFPMVWAPGSRSVSAVNVTSRYANKEKVKSENTRVLLKVTDPQGKRVKAMVQVLDAETQTEMFRGLSKDEGSDTNDFLVAQLPRHAHFLVKLAADDAPVQKFETGDAPDQVVSIQQTAISTATSTALQKALAAYFVASPRDQQNWTFSPQLEMALRADEAGVRKLAWEAYKASPIHAEALEDLKAKQVRWGKYLSPYLVKTVGTKPANGWGLVIAMHGGGGTAKAVNDSQWQGMFSHYKDHPELGGYIYLALRAPNDTWNGFYDDYVYPLVANLIQEYTLSEGVDPNKVYIMGYSHGGYGAYAIGPKMPDRFAAIHASAGAATDGETAGKNLRNTKFTAMVGEKDLAYDRLSRNQRFDAEIKALRGDRTDIYPVRIDVMAGFEHGNLKDGEKLVEMLPVTRNPVPRDLTWLMTDTVITDFFWLHTDTPAKTKEIDATCKDNKVTVTTTNSPSATVYLDSRLVDFSKAVQFEVDGQKSEKRLTPSLKTLCETLAKRGDPDLAFTAEVNLIPKK